MSWLREELSGTNLGDLRRTRRLIRVVEGLATQPQVRVLQASP